jgi:hypothetical protein
MTTNPYHRAVRRWLRSEYGVSSKVQHGTNHPYLAFEYGGKLRRVTLHNDSRETNALVMKVQDIRRELGAPLERAAASRRKMEDMMPELVHGEGHRVKVTTVSTTPSNDKTNAKLAVYSAGRGLGYRVKVMVRDVIADRFDGTLSTLRLDDETWTILQNGASRAKFRRESTGWQSITASLQGEHSPFGASPAEAVEIDGTLTVHCPIATRVKLNVPIRKPTLHERETITPENIVEKLKAAIIGVQPDPDFPSREHMRRTLALIVEIERRGVFRLVKVGGAWRFRAPDVALEEEEG